MTDTFSSTRYCGALGLVLPADTAGVLACHFGDRQKMHGDFNAFLAAPMVAVSLAGSEALVCYRSSEGGRRAFFGTCGARLVKEQTAAARWRSSAGLTEGPTGWHIQRNLWARSKPDWYELPDSRT
jgi:hypothetical protein